MAASCSGRPAPRPIAGVTGMVGTGMNPFLLRQMTRGEYVVDPRAVAEAMLTRLPRERSFGGPSGVLVSLERDPLAGRSPEDGPRAG